jgi:hypothetical protein
MTDFECDACEKIFTTKQSLEYHKRNNACKDPKYECKYCSSSYTTQTSMYRHMRAYCKVKKIADQEKDKIYESLIRSEENKRLTKIEQENVILRQKLEKMEKNIKEIKNVTVNNRCNINNGTMNFVLVGYGKEDMNNLNIDDIFKVMSQGFNSPLTLTEIMHFNPKYPEYHNVYVTNMKGKYAMMYDGSKWSLTFKDELINRIYNDKRNFIEENLDEFLESLRPSQKKALERWLDIDDEDDERIRSIKDKMKLMLYNMRHLPLKLDISDTVIDLNDGTGDIKIIKNDQKECTYPITQLTELHDDNNSINSHRIENNKKCTKREKKNIQSKRADTKRKPVKACAKKS